MTIRLAQPDDLGAIEHCAISAYEMYIQRIGKKPAPMVADFRAQIDSGIVWVSTDEHHQGDGSNKADGININPHLQGFIVYFPKPDCLFLENIAVSPRHQGKGIGKRLIRHCENAAKMLALPRVELYTNEKMTENLRLYPRLGYTETERRKEDGFNRVYFSREIQSRAL